MDRQSEKNKSFRPHKSLGLKGFIEKAKKIHGEKYDYTNSVYVNCKTKLIISCKVHGDFLQKAGCHLEGKGCYECGKQKRSDKNWPCQTKEDFIKKARLIHGYKYNYDNSIIGYAMDKSIFVCPDHGEFKQSPNKHLQGRGCGFCGLMKSGEIRLVNFLKRTFPNENIICQAKFSWLGPKKSIDIYLPNLGIAIEYQGEQHYKPVDFFGGEKSHLKQVKRDKEKLSLCQKNNLKLIHFSYQNYKSAKNSWHPLTTSESELLQLLPSCQN
jgi:hypothetical protein